MILALEADEADDWAVNTGESHSIKDFLDVSFEHIGIDNWSSYVKQDPRFMRPAEVDCLRGDYSKAKYKLGWEPEIDFCYLVESMVEADLKLLGNLNG